MAYREPLPVDCPPDDAEEINFLRIVYRLVRNDPPSDVDFRSKRAQSPNHRFREPDSECILRGLSVFSTPRDAEKLLEARYWRGASVCRVELGPGAGSILQTGENSDHYTWWPLADFDILANCRMV